MSASKQLYEIAQQLRRLRDPDGELHLQRFPTECLLGYLETIAESVGTDEAASGAATSEAFEKSRRRQCGTVIDLAAARRVRRRLHGLPPAGGDAA